MAESVKKISKTVCIVFPDKEYYQKCMEDLALKKQQDLKKQEQGTFGETGDVRTIDTAPKLTEQQEHMADLIDM